MSICVPMYNSAKTIRKTLASIIGQSYRNIEIIVVDNCSTDDSAAIVQTFSDPRIRIVRNEIHYPCGEYNWNRCFDYATGEYMAIFHADDLYLPETVARQVRAFREIPSLVGVFTQADVIDEDDTLVDALNLPPTVAPDRPYTYSEILPITLEYGDIFPCPSAMIRRDVYQKMAPFRYEQFGTASDLDMWMRVAQAGPVLVLGEKLLRYRVSRTQGSFFLLSRTSESDGFRTLDYHIRENGNDSNLSPETLGKYELRRMEDQIFCAINLVKKRDHRGCAKFVSHMPWRRYVRIIVTKPRISLPVLWHGCSKLWKNVKPVGRRV